MNQITKMLVLLLFCIFSLGTLSGCINDDPAAQREKDAAKADEIIIGVPVPLDFAEKNTKFLKGINLALEHLNATGVDGKKIKLEIVDDKGNFKTAVDTAQEFSENTRMVAVIGHWYSDICIPVPQIYEEASMLNIVPTVSNPELTAKDYKYVFQSITSDKKIAAEMCAYAKSKGYKRVVICYEESSYGENLANAIEVEAEKNDIKVIDRTAGLLTEEQFKKAHDKWASLEFDAVLMALNMPEGGNYIKALRKLNKDVGIISADGLDVSSFIEDVGKDAEGVVVFTNYSPYSNRAQLEQFKNSYRQKYNEEPDVWAIQGYEALQIIAHAIEQTKSYSPAVLADYLHHMEPWSTVSGEITFNENGEIEGKEVYKKVVMGGQFQYIN